MYESCINNYKPRYAAIVAFILFLAMVVSVCTGCTESAVLDEIIVYPVEGNIHSLNIQVNTAAFTIRDSDQFYVESNLKNLTVNAENGTLTVKEETKFMVSYEEPVFVLHMPTDTLFDNVRIVTGAAKLTASELNTDTLDMKLGAGDLSISKLLVTSTADIQGGAGKITISDGTIHNLDLEMGVGGLYLAAKLIGNNDLSLGVGSSKIHLLGGKELYRLDIEEGLGDVEIDGNAVTDFNTIGNGDNRIDIEGSVGEINIFFSH